MAFFKGPDFIYTADAGGDLSAAQFKFVKLSAGQVVVCTAITDKVLGILQNKPDAAGKAAQVLMSGITKLSADSAIAVDDLVGTSTDGQGDTIVAGTDTTVYAVARCVGAAGAAGQLATVAINTLSLSRAA